MTLQRQSVNLVLYQGIDTKTNSKLVEGKLLEMENCEINNQLLVKSPGSDALAESQTNFSDPFDQKGVTTDKNTLLVADNNLLYKYNSDQNALNVVDNLIFADTEQFSIDQNVSESVLTTPILPGTPQNVNQLPYPYATLGAPTVAGFCVPQPISCQFGQYLFTVVFKVTNQEISPLIGLQGDYHIALMNATTKTTIFETSFPNTSELPQDAVATPNGVFLYTVNVSNGHVNESYISNDLSLVFMSPTTPYFANIFPIDPVMGITRGGLTGVPNLTNYCSFLSVEYAQGFNFFAFREGVFPNYVGYMAKRNLNGGNAIVPTAVTGALVFDATQGSQNLCTTIFTHPDVDTQYFVAVYGTEYRIISCADGSYISRASFSNTSVGAYSTHSLGFLTKYNQLVALIHDIREFDGSATINLIAPTVNIFQLNITTPGNFNLTPVNILLGANSDSRRLAMYGTSAIAGRVLCVYDKITVPIFYFCYLLGTDGVVPYFTPFGDRRNSAHLVQILPTINVVPANGSTKFSHVTWIKEYACSIYNVPTANNGVIPSLMKSKIPDDSDNDCFFGFYVKTQLVSIAGQVSFSHQINAYNVTIPNTFNFDSFTRSAVYFGSGKVNEITQSTFSEMNFFEFPQVSGGAFAPSVTPNIPNGKYLYGVYYEWTNGDGELVRSETQEILYTVDAIGPNTGATSVNIFITPPPFFSTKTDVVMRLFRSTINGSVLFFDTNLLVSTAFPVFVDTKTDVQIRNNEIIYTNGGILGDFPFFAVQNFTLFKNCLFAIDSNDRNKIRFTKAQTQGIALASNEAFYFFVDSRGGECKALINMDDKLLILKETLLFVVSGDVPTDDGLNSTLSFPQFITTAVGCSQVESIINFPNGVIFKSKKGIWHLDRSLNSEYIGADVELYNNLTISSAKVLTSVNKVKFSTLEGTMIVYDYYYNTWNIESYIEGIEDLTIVNDSLVMITTTGRILRENPAISLRDGANYSMRFTSGWIKLAGLSGFQRLFRIIFLGTYTGSHILKASIYYDYDNEPLEFHYFNPSQNLGVFNAFVNYTVDNILPYNNVTWGEVLPYAGYQDSTYMFRINPRQQRCTAVKITIEDVFTGLSNQTGASFTATSLNFDIGVKRQTPVLPSRLQV